MKVSPPRSLVACAHELPSSLAPLATCTRTTHSFALELVHVLISTRLLAGYELSRRARMQGAAETACSATTAIGAPLFASSRTQPPHRTLLCPTNASACLRSHHVLIWQEQCSHLRRHDLDELMDTVGVEVHKEQRCAQQSSLGWVEGWVSGQGCYPGEPRPGTRWRGVRVAMFWRLEAAERPALGSRISLGPNIY